MSVEHEILTTDLIQWPQNDDLPHKVAFSQRYCAMNIGAVATIQCIDFCFTYSYQRLQYFWSMSFGLRHSFCGSKKATCRMDWHFLIDIVP
jgi:hypothetical protein